MQHFSERLAAAIRVRRSFMCVGRDPALERNSRCSSRNTGPGQWDSATMGPWPPVSRRSAVARSTRSPAVPPASSRRPPSSNSAAQPDGASWAPSSDALTASPYLGADSLEPLVARCADGTGVFVLARTSIRGAALLQERDVEGRRLHMRVAELVAELRAGHIGEAGYSDVGAVAGATSPASLRLVRDASPHAFLLVPGHGAQGAGADALAGVAAGDAAGFVVNASRSIIYAWQAETADYRRAAAAAAESMRDDLAFAL